jgi:hypothetical protein
MNPVRLGRRPLQQKGDGLARGLAHIVRDAGPESHLDHPVEMIGQRAVNGKLLDDRIGQEPGSGSFQVPDGKPAVDGVNIDRPHLIHGKMKIFDDASFYLFSQGVPDASLKADFNSMGHAFSFLIEFGKRRLFLPQLR